MKRTVGLRRTICNHPARPQIDLAIATGLAKRAVAERFSVSRDAVWRHAQAHLTVEMRAALATKLLQREGATRRIRLEEGAGVTEALKAIRGPLFGLFLAAVDTGDNKAASALSGRLHENLALTAKLTGKLVPHSGTSITNILLSPDFQRLRAELIGVLARYPEAQAEVAAVFRQAGLRTAAEMGASGRENDRSASRRCRLTSLLISPMRSILSRSYRIGSNSSPTPGRRPFCARARRGSFSTAAGNPANRRRRPRSRSTRRSTIRA